MIGCKMKYEVFDIIMTFLAIIIFILLAIAFFVILKQGLQVYPCLQEKADNYCSLNNYYPESKVDDFYYFTCFANERDSSGKQFHFTKKEMNYCGAF